MNLELPLPYGTLQLTPLHPGVSDVCCIASPVSLARCSTIGHLPSASLGVLSVAPANLGLSCLLVQISKRQFHYTRRQRPGLFLAFCRLQKSKKRVFEKIMMELFSEPDYSKDRRDLPAGPIWLIFCKLYGKITKPNLERIHIS